MSKITYKIKDGKLYTYKVEEIKDYCKLLQFDWNLDKLRYDIRNCKDSQFKAYLKVAAETFASYVSNYKQSRQPNALGKHSIFYYMYGHTNQWLKLMEDRLEKDLFLLRIAKDNDTLTKVLIAIRESPSMPECEKKLEKLFSIGHTTAQQVARMSLSHLTSLEVESAQLFLEDHKLFVDKVRKINEYDNNQSI